MTAGQAPGLGETPGLGGVVPELVVAGSVTTQPIRRVLVVVAHPDDETLTAGAALAALAQHCEVTVVTCTRGERGEMIGSALAPLLQDTEALAAHRVGELQAALAALGVAEHVFLDTVDGGARLVDSGMRWDEAAPLVRALPAVDAGPQAFSTAPLGRSISNLTDILDRVQPDLVLVDEPGGGYGHPDHRRAHEVTMVAVDRAAQRPAFIAWLVRAESAVRAAQAWLRSRPDLPSAGTDGSPLFLPEADAPLPSIVRPDAGADIAIDVTAHVPALSAAMRAHASQVQAVTVLEPTPDAAAAGWFALSNGQLQPILTTAWLAMAPGGGDRVALRAALSAMRPATATTRIEAAPASRWYKPAMLLFSLVLGVVLAAVGTAFHRLPLTVGSVTVPIGLVAALAGVACAGLLARTFADRLGNLFCGVAAVATVLLMTYVRPGEDLLVTDQPVGLVWLIGCIPAALLLPALAPRRWFADHYRR